MDRMAAARADCANNRRSPGYTRPCFDLPSEDLRTPSSRTSLTYACFRAFSSRTSLHNVHAGSAALRAAVSSSLGATAALFVGFVILSGSAPPVLPSPLTNRGARMSVAHIVTLSHSRALRRLGTTHSLAGGAIQTPLGWQLRLPSSSTKTIPAVLLTSCRYASLVIPQKIGLLRSPVPARQRRHRWSISKLYYYPVF
ncbi:hypothetical protein K466DRAFT_231575 [Polyporus arcularius HHB13444]|uniref:Uncharacterized protein n=1 Tax=Polyporus arcularius HHB13444 TaxID=1314778 RepID=A0A5C3P3K3_9APHY|nr:hypothetical protein K466DRAFT_231575 [Polyporus arcularius HHB13444]